MLREARTAAIGLAFLASANPQVPRVDGRRLGGEQAFEAEVHVVNVYATVKDRQGQVMTDLTAKDLLVWEDGFVQDISHFSWVADWSLDIGLLGDTSLNQAALLPAQRRVGLEFFRSVLRPRQDRAFLITFDSEVELAVESTEALSQLTDGLDNLHVRPYAFLVTPPDTFERRGTALFDAVYLASREVFSQRGRRRFMVVISDGYDAGSVVSTQRAIRAALRSDVVVYSIQFLDEEIAGKIYRDRLGAGSAALERISAESGGSFHRVTRDVPLTEVFRMIEDEMRGSYSMGYKPSRGFEDPSCRRIEVTSPRTDVGTIQARDGYYPDQFLGEAQ